MADPVAVEALRAAVAAQAPPAWQQFCTGRPGPVDLVQADLAGLSLRGFDLSGADLMAATLTGADLTQARLAGVRLAYANLGRANLARADAGASDLLCANLQGANLVETRLGRACLRGATLDGGYLIGADCVGADFSNASFRGAKLKSLNLTQSRLTGADMDEAELIDVALATGAVSGLLHFDRAVVRSPIATAPGGRLAPLGRNGALPAPGEDNNPWAVLGIPPDADIRAIALAYRQQAKLHHPDRVAGLGEKIRRLAHSEFVRIQNAYQTLMSEVASPLADMARADGSSYAPECLEVEDYLRLLADDPDNATLRYNLGVKYLEAGRNRRAAEAFEAALRLAPDHEDARYNLRLARLVAGLQGDEE